MEVSIFYQIIHLYTDLSCLLVCWVCCCWLFLSTNHPHGLKANYMHHYFMVRKSKDVMSVCICGVPLKVSICLCACVRCVSVSLQVLGCMCLCVCVHASIHLLGVDTAHTHTHTFSLPPPPLLIFFFLKIIYNLKKRQTICKNVKATFFKNFLSFVSQNKMVPKQSFSLNSWLF